MEVETDLDVGFNKFEMLGENDKRCLIKAIELSYIKLKNITDIKTSLDRILIHTGFSTNMSEAATSSMIWTNWHSKLGGFPSAYELLTQNLPKKDAKLTKIEIRGYKYFVVNPKEEISDSKLFLSEQYLKTIYQKCDGAKTEELFPVETAN